MVFRKRFEVVPRGNPKVIQARYDLKLSQLAIGNTFRGDKPCNAVPSGKSFGFPISK